MSSSVIRALLSTTTAATLVFAAGCGGGSGSSTPDLSISQATGNTITGIDSSGITLTGSSDATASKGEKMYIVRLRDEPLAAYEGGVDGFKGTAPAAGQKLDDESVAAVAYKARLEDTQRKVLGSVASTSAMKRSFTHSFNGFSAKLTAAQAQKLSRRSDVLNVWEDELREINTNFSNDFLELDDPGAGLRANLGFTGRGVVVGVIDTGTAFPKEHPSLRDDDGFGRPSRWRGICEPGENFTADDCNDKVIGARFYLDGFGVGNIVDEDFLSPLDFSDHGTHTATTAAGNRVEDAELAGINVGTISGMAPDAWISVYKTCWLAPNATNFSCAVSDLVAAIEQATRDRVDVINYSIGSTAPGLTGPDDIAFLGATRSGVFVASSAGNAGPGPATVGSPANPWIASVGASTRTGETTALALAVNSPESVAGDYAALEGAITQPLDDSGTITDNLTAADPLLACDPLTNDLTGTIAFIERGACAFVTKVENAVNAGAIGVVLFTDARPKTVMGGTPTATTQSVPGVMIDRAPGLDILAALASDDVEVTLGPLGPDNTIQDPIAGNVMASFSSRGFNRSAPDIIKPDVTAPGVSILAGYSRDGETGRDLGYLSGTSMSSPHVAGIGALLTEGFPRWTPGEIKSALMTTARQDVVKEDGSTPADPFDFGSGHIVPNSAADPGLLYTTRYSDYQAFLCGSAPEFVSETLCDLLDRRGISTDASDLNIASFGIAELVGTQTVKRRVRAAGGNDTTWTVSVDAPPGISVEVNPSTFTVNAGARRDTNYEVTFTVEDDAVLTEWAFGSLTWSDGTRDVRSPIAVRPFGISFEGSAVGTGADGSDGVDVKVGFTGDYTAGAHGMVEALLIDGVVEDDPFNNFEFLGEGTEFEVIDVPAGTALLRTSIFNEDVTGNSDLDLYVYYCPGFACGGIRGQSTNADSNETVDIVLPEPGFWVVFIHGFETDGPDSTYQLNAWGVSADPAADDGSLTVNGSAETVTIPVAAGDEFTLNAAWSGLGPARYLGAISHFSPGGLEGLTIVEVDAR